MYLRLTQRHNRDGSTVAYYGLAENVWNPETKRAEARVVHSFGRAERLDRDALRRLVKSINRVLGAEEPAPEAAHRLPVIEIDRVSNSAWRWWRRPCGKNSASARRSAGA
jgi:hypothetical protein